MGGAGLTAAGAGGCPSSRAAIQEVVPLLDLISGLGRVHPCWIGDPVS